MTRPRVAVMEGRRHLQEVQWEGPTDWAWLGGAKDGSWVSGFHACSREAWEWGRKSSGGHLIGGAFETPTDV